MNESVTVHNFLCLLHPYNTSLVTRCDTKEWAKIIAIAGLEVTRGEAET